MSAFQEFAAGLERRKRRSALRRAWVWLMRSREAMLWLAIAFIALGSFVAGVIVAGLAPR